MTAKFVTMTGMEPARRARLALVRMEVRDSLNLPLRALCVEIGPENPHVDYQAFAERQLKAIRDAGEWRARELRFVVGDRVLGSSRCEGDDGTA